MGKEPKPKPEPKTKQADLERYERIVDRAHKEIEGVRQVYMWLATTLGVILATAIACGTFLTYNTINDMQSDLNQRTNQLADEVKARIEKEFEQPAIKVAIKEVAAEQASALMTEQITPEVTKFKSDVNNQLKNLNELVATIEKLKTQSEKNEREIQTVVVKLKKSLEQNQNQLSAVKSDVVETQKHLATIQYYQIAGINRIPNPYKEEMLAALNKLVAIAIPDHAERSKFIAELQDTQKPKK